MEEEEQIEERKPQKSVGLQQALGDGDCILERLWMQSGGPSPGHRHGPRTRSRIFSL